MLFTAVLAKGFASSSFISFSIFIICALLLLYAVAAGWYGVDKKKAAVIISACAVTLIAACAYTVFFTNGFQKQRLLAFFNQESYVNEANYQLTLVRRAFDNAEMVGNGLESLDKRLVHENTFLIVAQTVAMYGLIAGTAIVAAFLLFAERALKIVKRQKNQLGMIMSASCFLVVAFNCAMGIFMNLGLCPMGTLQFPFLCAGGSATIMYSVIIGLLMNCKKCEILREKSKKAEAKV